VVEGFLVNDQGEKSAKFEEQIVWAEKHEFMNAGCSGAGKWLEEDIEASE
jgi:hypothetical protein